MSLESQLAYQKRIKKCELETGLAATNGRSMPLAGRKVMMTPSGISQSKEETDRSPCLSHSEARTGGVDAKEERALGGKYCFEFPASFREYEIGGGDPRFLLLTCLRTIDGGLQLLGMGPRGAEIMTSSAQGRGPSLGQPDPLCGGLRPRVVASLLQGDAEI